MKTKPSSKLLDTDLNPTLDEAEARFSEESHFLKTYMPELYDEVKSLHLNDRGVGFPYKNAQNVSFHNGKWSDHAGKGFVFAREEGPTPSWVTKIKGHTVPILATCDGRDAAQWLSAFKGVASAKPSNPLSKINLLKNAEFVLGAVGTNPQNVAGAGARTVYFFNHHEVDRLLTCGIEAVTRSGK